MPGKNNKPKTPAGKSGLNTETANEGQPQDQNMNPGESSEAAAGLPRQESSSEEKGNASELSSIDSNAWKFSEEKSDAALKAYDELYGDLA